MNWVALPLVLVSLALMYPFFYHYDYDYSSLRSIYDFYRCGLGKNGTNCENDYSGCIRSIKSFFDAGELGSVCEYDGPSCFNGGTCWPANRTFVCVCPSYHNGTRCENNYSGCESNPCKKEQNCLPLKSGDFSCETIHENGTITFSPAKDRNFDMNIIKLGPGSMWLQSPQERDLPVTLDTISCRKVVVALTLSPGQAIEITESSRDEEITYEVTHLWEPLRFKQPNLRRVVVRCSNPHVLECAEISYIKCVF